MKVSASDALVLFRMCLARSRSPEEQSRILEAMSALSEAAAVLPHPPGREHFIGALVRALRTLTREEWRRVVTESAEGEE